MSAKRTLLRPKAISKRRPFWSSAASWGCPFIGLVLASSLFCVAFTSSADVDSSVSSLVRSRAIYVVDDDKEVTMLRREFRHDALYRYVMYGRMSDPGQNERSPDQQFAMITDVLRQRRLPWQHVGTYRDDGRSGRYVRKRKGFAQMLMDIRSGAMVTDLILVDTTDRFGRVKELPEIRRMLRNQHGVLVLAANSGFADPTSSQGEAHAAFENYRSSEEGRVKAHQVRRGKRDLIERGLWPGGPAPFGFKLELVSATKRMGRDIRNHRLVHNEENDWIARRMFELSDGPGEPGQDRVAELLNDDPSIPDRFKPFFGATVGNRLDNPIYAGTLRWDAHSTDIEDDTRVIERNPEEMVLYKTGFCEPIVDPELFDRVQLRRTARAEALIAARGGDESEGKLIAPIAPGLALKYMLTGLARCGTCGRSMTPSSSGLYVPKRGGEPRRYVAYVCPGSLDGSCDNDARFKEPWLREQVIAAIKRRLFPWIAA
jgi:DNA invertase Pin-like site-specific DNA recombinase